MCIEPIGYVANNIDLPMDCGWAKVESRIVLQENLVPALLGLGDFSHLLDVFWMHQAKPPTVLQEDLKTGMTCLRRGSSPSGQNIVPIPLG